MRAAGPVVGIVAGVALAAAVVAAAAPRATPRVAAVSSVTAACAGDVISGKARFARPGKGTLVLLQKRTSRASFVATGLRRTLRAAKPGTVGFRFDISRLDAVAYRVDATRTVRSKPIPSSACAPDHEVPEAPFALLLPIGLLLALGLPIVIRQRRLHPRSG